MAAVVRQYGVGIVVQTSDPFELALAFTKMLTDNEKKQDWYTNLEKASRELCWENEERKLIAIYYKALAAFPTR
jgi:hypothetical protein